LFASESPFPNYTTSEGKNLIPAQANDSWIFPPVGFGLLLLVLDTGQEKFLKLLFLLNKNLDQSNLHPPLDKIRDYALGEGCWIPL
jgi:malate dehydrogenase (oxaloacetate-decarboxylating)/malate dehydrogenase (oxaloacetate-decarboxylating)(NADP+)